MATFKEALQYAEQNPTSDFAKELETGIKSGQFIDVAKSEGVDLTPFVVEQVQPEQKGAGVATGIVKGLGSTVTGLAELGNKVLSPIEKGIDKLTGTQSKSMLPSQQELEQSRQEFKPIGTAEKIGFGAEQLAEFFIPGSKTAQVEKLIATKGTNALPELTKLLSKIPKIGTNAPQIAEQIINTGAKSLVRAGEGAGITAIQTGGDMDSVTGAAKISGAFPILGQIASRTAPLIKSLGGGISKRLAAGLSGRGTAVIDEIARNPKVALEALAKDSFENLSNNATKLRQSVANLDNLASTSYVEELKNLPKRLGRNPSVVSSKGITTIKADGKTYKLSTLGVKQKLTSELRNFGVEVNPKSRTFDFMESPFVDAEENVLKKVFGVVNNWTDSSPEGLETLAVKIGRFRKNGTQSTQLNSVIDSMKRNVRNYLGERVPQAKKMVQDFANIKDKVDAYDDLFATSGKNIGGTSERIETGQKISQLFSGEKTEARKLLSELPGAENIPTEEAARQLVTAPERAAGQLGELLRSAIQTVITPKLIGQITAQTSLKAEQVPKLIETLKKAEPAVRGIIIDALAKD